MHAIDHDTLAASLAHLVRCSRPGPGIRIYGVYQHPGCSRGLHLPVLSDLLATVQPFVASPAEALTTLAGLIAHQGAGRLGVYLGGLVGVAAAVTGWRIDFDHPDAPKPEDVSIEGIDEQPYAHFGLQFITVCADDVVHTITGDGEDVTSFRSTITDQPGLHLESIKAVFTALMGTGGSTLGRGGAVRQ